MTLDLLEWCVEEHARIARFMNDWQNQNHADAEKFPFKMEAGEWDEQYRMWEE